MTSTRERRRLQSRKPRVFVSYARPDQDRALRLERELTNRGADVFIDDKGIGAGSNIWATISREIGDVADYFVLLWSADAVDRLGVEAEWTSALDRDLRERSTFLFVVRLDDTDPPQILRGRLFLDAWPSDAQWIDAIERLEHAWRRDRTGSARPLRPAPLRPPDLGGEDLVEVVITNTDLEVDHLLMLPRRLDGADLHRSVRVALDLPTEPIYAVRNRFGMAFEYRLIDGASVVHDDDQIVEFSGDRTTLELQIETTILQPGTAETTIYRHDVPNSTIDLLFRSAFARIGVGSRSVSKR